jgi:hypothetical protein
MAIQIECMRRVLAARIRRHLDGDAVERQGDDGARGPDGETVIRYFLWRRLGPLAIAPLSIRASELAWPGALESPPGLANRIPARFATAAHAAVRLSPIASRTEEEHLPAIAAGAEDEANGQHGRAAREVGHPDAVMRCSAPITAE